MFEKILPATSAVVTAHEDIEGTVLFAEEEEMISRAVEKRQREFTTARACAREALARLGVAPTPILSGSSGEPQWPSGIVGSITHCDGFRACALARASDLATIGIDAEPNQPLPDGLLGDIALPEERGRLSDLGCRRPEVHWDRLLFSIKESIYKAWFPLAGRWLGFEDAIVEIDLRLETFSARFLVPGPLIHGCELTGFSGRWLVRDGLLFAAIALPPEALGRGARLE
jgi:enterobactin synthetase component D / holo-[acyl-carrier protein] synthase